MARLVAPLLFALTLTHAQQDGLSIPGSSAYTVKAGFPTSAFSSYWEKPVSTQEPQPALYDPVLNITFPLNLTDPETIPTTDNDPVLYPESVANITNSSSQALLEAAFTNISGIILGNTINGNCSKCQASLGVAKVLAQYAPTKVPTLLIEVCEAFKFRSNASCVANYAAGSYGAIWTQVLALADVGGLDGQYICNDLSTTFCPAPMTSPLNVTGIFPQPKPANATGPKASGKRVKVLHLSDFHIDPRYSVGSEANCSSGLCCRTNVHAAGESVGGQISLPAPLYGSFECDTPYYLGLAALQAIAPLTGTSGPDSLAWTIYTGDLVSHDSQNQLSRAYVEYTETSVFDLFKAYIGSPVFPVLGNHDSNPEAIDAPHRLPGPLGQQFSWNYDHVASLWQQNGWINSTVADEARLHYGAYSVTNQYGLRIITLNTDFWLKSNFL